MTNEQAEQTRFVTPTVERPKFWSDDFDMDLLKIFPQAIDLLGDTAERRLYTVGHETHGRLNHPTVWNSYGAFLWLEKPNLPRDEHGWFRISGHVSDEPEIECTWLEFLRDAWPHGYGWMLLPMQFRFAPPPQNDFMSIMYDLRGWQKTDVSDSRQRALHWLVRSNEKLKDALRLIRPTEAA